MLFKTLLFNWLTFCSKKNLYRATIYSCYDEYKSCYYSVKNKDNNIHPYMDTEEWNKINPETKQLMRENAKKQSELVDELVLLVKLYCKKYPDEKICNHYNFKTYDEYPYRLPQTISEFIRLL